MPGKDTIKYFVEKHFKGEPASLAEIRKHTVAKLNDFSAQGTWALIMEADDGQPVLIISETGKVKDYTKLIKVRKDVIWGNYIGDSGKKAFSFLLTDGPEKDQIRANYEAILKKKDALSIAMWACFAQLDVNSILVDQIPMQKRVLNDVKWKICDWSLGDMLFRADLINYSEGSRKLTAELHEKEGRWEMPNGLCIGIKLKLSVTIHGKIAEKSSDNPMMAAFTSEHIKNPIKYYLKPLALKLDELDHRLGKDPAAGKEIMKEASEAIDQFMKDTKGAIRRQAEKNFLEYLEARVLCREYEIDTAIEVVEGVAAVGVGIAVAVGTHLSGVGAILGFIGTMKAAAETIEVVYRFMRDTEELGLEINSQLLAALTEIAAQEEEKKLKDAKKGKAGKDDKGGWGWQNLENRLIKETPVFGPLYVNIAAKKKKNPKWVKSVKDLKKDTTAYEAKVAALVVKAMDLGKNVLEVTDESTKAIDKCEEEEAALAKKNPTDPKIAKIQARREKIAATTTEFLDKFGNYHVRYMEGKKLLNKTIEPLLAELEKTVKADAVPNLLEKFLVPLANLPWCIDPGSAASTVLGASGVCMEIAKGLMDDIPETDPAFSKAKSFADKGSWALSLVEAFTK